MKIDRLVGHAYTMLRRELGCGEYRLTLFALLVGVISVTALSLTTSRIQNAMQGQAVDLLGGDIVLRSTSTIDASIFDIASRNNLDYSLSVSSFTMANHGDNFLLSSVRAVDDSYPLKGAVSTQVTRDSEPVAGKVRPATGEAWVEKRFLDRLDVELGDQIEVGLAQFKLTKILESEPDRSGSLYALNPRVLINWQDLKQTKLVQPSSRLWYKLMLSGQPADVEQFVESLSGQLNSSQRLVEPQDSADQINENLTRANVFINLGALLSVILCGIAVSLAASRHAHRHIDQVALLRCFGFKSSQVNWLYTLQLLFISIPAILLGLLIGYLVHEVLMQLIKGLFTRTLPVASLSAWLSGPITALCMVLGFGLPPLLRLAKTPPAHVFRKELASKSAVPWIGAAFALLALVLMAWWQTDDLRLATVTILGLVAVISVLSLLIMGLLKLVAGVSFSSAPVRGALANMVSRPSLTATQIVGFGVTLFAIALIILFRNDVFEQWNKQVPDDAPNRFVFDLSADDRQAFADVLTENAIDARIFPTVRGRLTKINGKVVQKAVSKEGNNDQEALNRDLSLTQTDTLPVENTIVAGAFQSEFALANSVTPVSIESQLAEQLAVEVGDELEFLIQGQSLTATITSLREVNWKNFRPNFYMIFPLGTLDSFSQSSLTSFYLPEDKIHLDKQLNQQFVGTSMINVDFIIKRIQRILIQLSSAMQLTFGMAIVAGMAVFWAALLIAFDEKQQQAALLRALGASRKTVSLRFITEQMIVGLLSGLLTGVCLLIVSYLISTRVLELPWQAPWLYVLVLPAVMMGLLAGLSSIQLSGILRQAPYPILKRIS